MHIWSKVRASWMFTSEELLSNRPLKWKSDLVNVRIWFEGKGFGQLHLHLLFFLNQKIPVIWHQRRCCGFEKHRLPMRHSIQLKEIAPSLQLWSLDAINFSHMFVCWTSQTLKSQKAIPHRTQQRHVVFKHAASWAKDSRIYQKWSSLMIQCRYCCSKSSKPKHVIGTNRDIKQRRSSTILANCPIQNIKFWSYG